MSFNEGIVALTGATGFIGTHVREKLQGLNCKKVVLFSRQADLGCAPNEVIVKGGLSSLSGAALEKAGIYHIDHLVHLAGFAPKNNEEAEAIDANLRDNVYATHQLLKSLPNKPKRIIFASTLDVYSPLKDGEVLTEESRVGNASFYGHTKLLSEALIRSFCRANGVEYAILRYGHIYGPGEQAYKKLIPTTIRRLLSNEPPVIYGDGTALRDLLHVSDAVEATIRALDAPYSGIEAVNVVRGESVAIGEIVQDLVTITAFHGEIEYVETDVHQRSFRFDNKRMRELLGEWTYIPLHAGLSEEVESFRRP